MSENKEPKFTVVLSQAEARALIHGINWLTENWNESNAVLGQGALYRLANIGHRVSLKLNSEPKQL